MALESALATNNGSTFAHKYRNTYFWVIFLFQSFVKCSAYARTGHFEFFKMNCDISYFSPNESRTNGLRLSWLTLRGHFASFRLWRCRKRVIQPGEATKLSTSSCFAIAIACDLMQGPVKLFPKIFCKDIEIFDSKFWLKILSGHLTLKFSSIK